MVVAAELDVVSGAALMVLDVDLVASVYRFLGALLVVF